MSATHHDGPADGSAARSASFEPATGRSVWRAADFADETSYIAQLTDPQIAELESLGARLAEADPDVAGLSDDDVVLAECAPAIADWAETLDHGRGFVTVRGLDPQAYSPEMAAAMYYALGLHLGQPIRQNVEGDVLTHIIAIADREAYNSEVPASKTTGGLVFHSDSSDVVGLFCIRPAPEGGASRLSCAATIYNEVLRQRPDLLPVLFEPFHFDWQLQDHTAPRPTYTSPIFSYVDGVLSMYGGSKIVFTAQSYDHVPRLTKEQIEALELVDSLAADPTIALDMDFQQGDIQWLLNYTALHSRTSFRDHADPALRRQLLRLWLRRDVGRPLVPGFGKPVGDLEVGEPIRPTFSALAVVPERLPVSY